MKFKPEDRKAQILTEAVRQAKTRGYQNVRVSHIADALGISTGLVFHHYPTVPRLKRAIMGEAIVRQVLEVVAQGLALKDARAMNAPESVKQAARATL